MGSFLRKDFLVLLRSKIDLLILLVMPFALTALLGFALGGVFGFGENNIDLHVKVAVVQEDDEQLGIKQFTEHIERMNLPDPAVKELHDIAVQSSPYALLEGLFQELNEIIDTEMMTAEAAAEALELREVDAILTIPEQFTYETLRKMLLDEGEGSQLHMMVQDYGSLKTQIFQDVVHQFVHSLNFETALHYITAASRDADGESSADDVSYATDGESSDAGHGGAVQMAGELGGIETITKQEPVNALQYYTLGMAVMFVLFVAGTMSEKAHVEMNQHVLNRILLSGKHPFVYLSSKAVSGACLSFVQLCILFVLSGLIFQTFSLESVQFWLGMLLISAVLTLCVGALSTLLTSITLSFDSQSVSLVFSAGLVSMMAFAGGSMFPITDMPDFVQTVGSWTPNGAALLAYLQWIQGGSWSDIMYLIWRLAGMSVLFFVASVLLFRQRGSV